METCGYRTGMINDASRPNWGNTADRPIAWSAWYPSTGARDTDQPIGQLFDLGNVIRNAPLIATKKLPVVLLSHGTGGTAESMGWLARSLACKDHVVIGANHHGNTGIEPYLAEGFLCWWERALDLSVLLTAISTTEVFADKLDLDRVSAIGFSLGGHTAMALSGALTCLDEFDAWHSANNISTGGPKEFVDAADHIPSLIKTSETFRRSWARHGDDVTDDRVKSIVAIAPAPPVRGFTSNSIARLQLPVTIITGGADQEAPAEHCADWLVQRNSEFKRRDLGRNVGHYTFLEFPSDKSLVGKVDIFTDHETINRNDIHQQVVEIVQRALP